MALIGAGAFAAGVIAAFLSIEGGAPEFQPPRPSNGTWLTRREILDLPDALTEVPSRSNSAGVSGGAAPQSNL